MEERLMKLITRSSNLSNTLDFPKQALDAVMVLNKANTIFQRNDTYPLLHKYKDYLELHPDWRIQPDPSMEASAYWKYVFARFNTQYGVEAADLPSGWDRITKQQALQSLEETFRMKT
ncbi:hypothetical protein AAFF_G00433730 [Aldrovandia affinis]|uniref:Uncharacterized protein n=1 Tax=Aldrovandia affinis TaxID=143900 RepID=A0AAD7VXP6_9TELE|nr:hypothetical protein AAFF_G00433730 [Aldrovandia affinis]